jgi:hypothetical protein
MTVVGAMIEYGTVTLTCLGEAKTEVADAPSKVMLPVRLVPKMLTISPLRFFRQSDMVCLECENLAKIYITYLDGYIDLIGSHNLVDRIWPELRAELGQRKRRCGRRGLGSRNTEASITARDRCR